ncbi:MAG: rRNA methyltransferase [Cyclobacteriaceae bacterium]|nr:rRNA methyltransferase [Cyclobacteriaceae bacterium]
MHKELSIPDDFQKIIKDLLGNESDSFFESLSTPSPPSVRLNPCKDFRLAGTSNIPWTQFGKYLKERPVYTLDPSIHAGAYYVQEPSSMFLEQAVLNSIDITQPLTVLDLCAAPGGKSTHLLSLLHPDSLLVSNETIRSRASILSENIQKWGYANVIVTNNDPSHFSPLHGLFDLIVVDAPCSGEGLFRKDNDALGEWSSANVDLCALRQRRILKDVWPALKQDGVLIFSTCTYNTQEDEETMEWLNQTGACEFLSIPIDDKWGVVETKLKNTVGYRFYPHKVRGEGFFLSAVRKKEPGNSLRMHTKYVLGDKCKNEDVKSWLKDSATFSYVIDKGIIKAVPAINFDLITFLSDKLHVTHFGISLATDKHGKLVPEHNAALSIHLDKSNFITIELSYEQAINYLRKETIEMDTKEKGFSLLTHEGNSIGWANLLPNRMNNLYPSNWRIRMKSN